MTTQTQLVLGAGADAIRVAASLLRQQPDQRLRVCLTAPALPDALACVERTSWRASDSAQLAAVVGPVQPVPDARAEDEAVGIVAQGAAHRLPLQPWTVGQLLQRGERRQAARSWLRARARNGLSVVVGGGQEERSYLDWVVRRMGRPAFESLYADYAARRWGRPGDVLAASVARQAHGGQHDGGRVRPVAPDDHGVSRAQGLLDAAGVEVVACSSARVRIENGRAVGIDGDNGLSWSGRLFTTLAPSELAVRLGEACPPTAHHLAASLAPEPCWRLRLSGAVAGVPDELHILDPAPCWRYVRAPDAPGDWLVSVTGSSPTEALAEDIRDHARQLGLVGDDARVLSTGAVPGGLPVWGPSDNARLRTVLEVWQKLGIQAVGRGGAHADLDPTQVLAHLQSVVDGADLLEAWRIHVAPPARAEDLDARITRFVAAG